MKFKIITANKLLAVAVCIVFLLTTYSFAKDKEPGDNYSLEPMTIIATKTPKASLDSPASISIITEYEYYRAPGRFWLYNMTVSF